MNWSLHHRGDVSCPLSERIAQSGCRQPSCLWAPLGQPQTSLEVMYLGGGGTQRWGRPCCHVKRPHHRHRKQQSCAGSSDISSSGLWGPAPHLSRSWMMFPASVLLLELWWGVECIMRLLCQLSFFLCKIIHLVFIYKAFS